MPLLYIHLSIAKDTADLLEHPLLSGNMGCYLGGAISPDAHLVSNVSRRETHFFDLDDEMCESGVSKMFSDHPGLSSAGTSDTRMKCFVAGYLSHLVTDEVWIGDIYRPFFGRHSRLAGDPMANVYDRLLQFEVDRRERSDKAKLEAIRGELSSWEPDNHIDFIDIKALRYWREFGCASANREVTVGDFSTFAKSFLKPRLKMSEAQLERFLSSVNSKIDWVVRYVTPERLEDFKRKSTALSVTVVKGYLNEDH